MRRSYAPFAALALVLVGGASRGEEAGEGPLVLRNRHLSLGFDRQTGAWTSLVDGRTGEELVAAPAPRAMVLPLPSPPLDGERLRRAIASGAAIDLSGEWLYVPAPAEPERAAAVVRGELAGLPWRPTTVPSRRGRGDDRLHERVGDFYYRREFRLPAGAPPADPLLLIGAVDDFDVTYVNGTRVGGTGLETPRFWETPRYYRLPPGLLRRDAPNVVLVKVTNGAFDGGVTGPAAVGPASALAPPPPAGPRLSGSESARSESAEVLTMVAPSPPYEYRMEVALPDDRPWFRRSLTVRNLTDKEVVLENQPSVVSPPLAAGPGQAVVFPGSLPVGDSPAAGLAEGEVLGPKSQDPLVVLWSTKAGRGIGSWFHDEEEFAPVFARRAGAGVEIRHAPQVIARLKPGGSVALGTQYFWLTRGGRDDALRGVRQVYEAIGLKTPAGGLAGLGEKVLYCGHPGGTPELGYRTYGGFAALERYLPTLRTMGVDLLWLLPIWEHGDGKQWNLYAPFDHFRVSPLYGTAEDLRRLSDRGAKDGIRLMFDLVPHGPPDSTPLAREHPEWVCRNRDGTPVYAWGQYAFDNADPGWQAYMRRAAEHDARQFGAVGARVDCGAGSPPNWSPARGDRPSHSTLAGALEMNRAIRDGFLRAGPEVVLLPEEYSGANIFSRVADLTYDAQLYFLLADLHERKASPEEWADRLQVFLHDQQMTLPPGALKMRWISNHDTVSWTFQKKRPIDLYGEGRMRALLALCAFVEGVPMLYQGDEDPAVYGGRGPSSVEVLARIYGLRKRSPALRRGAADYHSIRASGGVFACTRRGGGQEALVLIGLNPAPVRSRLAGPAALSGAWRDAFADEPLAIGEPPEVAMRPHQIRVLTRPRPD